MSFIINIQKAFSRKEVLLIALLVLLYVLIGNARSIQPNPIVPGAIIAVNMFVPVLAGILLGPRAGLLVGILGTLANALSPAGNPFEFAAILPHGIMGFIAGSFKDRLPTSILASSIIIGHLLNLVMFVAFRLLPFDALLGLLFWYALAFEALAGIVTITVLATIYRLSHPSSQIT